MFRKLGFSPFSVVVLAFMFSSPFTYAQTVDMGRRSRPRIAQNIDEGKLVRLTGNTPRSEGGE